MPAQKIISYNFKRHATFGNLHVKTKITLSLLLTKIHFTDFTST